MRILSFLAALLFSAAAFAQTPTTTTGTAYTGASHAKVLSTASTNANSIASGQHTLYDFVAVNTNATAAYLKFYDTSSAPTCNTDTVVATIPLAQNVPVSAQSFVGKMFSNGIGLCITGGI